MANSRQRRKWARKMNGGSAHPSNTPLIPQYPPGFDPETMWMYTAPSKAERKKQRKLDKERSKPIPGVTCPPEIPEFTQMVKRNKWHDRSELDEVINVIKEFSLDRYDPTAPLIQPVGSPVEQKEYWSWSRNQSCKYVDIRFDMRDGGFVMTDRDGKRICLEQLKWQWSKNEHTTSTEEKQDRTS